MFFWNSLAFSMIQRMLAIWSLVPLPFLNPAWTSGSSQFMYCWSLAWRMLSIALLACEMIAGIGVPGGLPSMGSQRVGHNWVTSLSHASKVVLKILQARLQQYMNCELPDVQAGCRKGRGTRDQIANICWLIKKKQESSRKTSIFALLTMPKPLTVWITANYGKFFKRWE